MASQSALNLWGICLGCSVKDLFSQWFSVGCCRGCSKRGLHFAAKSSGGL